MISTTHLSLLIAVVALLNVSILAQSKEDQGKVQKHSFYSRNRPIIFGAGGDGFPSDFSVSGKIIGVSDGEPACGVLATAGTLRIKLEKPHSSFKKGVVHLVVFCFNEKSRKILMNKSISINAKKIVNNPFDFDVSTANDFDSEGEPFYLSVGGGFGELRKYFTMSK